MQAVAAHQKKVLRLYRSLMRLATKYPESEIGWENRRVPMSDELRVEIRSSFKDNKKEQDPRRVERATQDAARLEKMLQLLFQDAFFRLYPTVREYHKWSGLRPSQLYELKESDK
ncbi:hypothetical protein DIPPA_10952 [Diplonema papillatum]|nr:hypothetical protein DIPPA_10952 [Diplonema papillatum]|eukprot:gene1052-1620_t